MGSWIAAAALPVAILLFVPPIAQDPAYHRLADARAWRGIPNAGDVLSNLPFLVVGLWGLVRSSRCNALVGRTSWQVFFLGVTLTAFGSGWYHLAPDDTRLVFDRLPMGIAFMGLVCAALDTHYGGERGRRLLPWMLALAITSVLWWAWTESRGRGDLRPWGIVQFYSMIWLVYVLIRRARGPSATAWWLALGAYALAKVCELNDVAIYTATGFVSGHTLKHLAAAAAPLALSWSLTSRSPPPLRDPPPFAPDRRG